MGRGKVKVRTQLSPRNERTNEGTKERENMEWKYLPGTLRNNFIWICFSPTIILQSRIVSLGIAAAADFSFSFSFSSSSSSSSTNSWSSLLKTALEKLILKWVIGEGNHRPHDYYLSSERVCVYICVCVVLVSIRRSQVEEQQIEKEFQVIIEVHQGHISASLNSNKHQTSDTAGGQYRN